MNSLRAIYASVHQQPPRSHTVLLRPSPEGTSSDYRHHQILLVDDDPKTTKTCLDVLGSHYRRGSLQVSVGHDFAAACRLFDEHHPTLVIMDADLDDPEGDGGALSDRFLDQRPATIILANSSSTRNNIRLMRHGALAIIGKDQKRLADWLKTNDPGR